MSRSDDQGKLSPKEQKALEQYVREHPKSTLLKDERTAKFILKVRSEKPGTSPSKWGEIRKDAEREGKYGRADWEPPDLTKPAEKRSVVMPWDALGRFVVLSGDALADFRRRYPSFLPAWFYDLPCGNSAEPPRSAATMLAWEAWQRLLGDAWHSGFHPEYVAQLVNIPTTPPGNTWFEVQPVCDAQRAVLAMALESWRARFCPKCGSPFVARKAADKYWPKKCFSEQRREKQRASKRKRARRRAKTSRRAKR